MPKVSPIQSAFNAGIFSEYMLGRVDFDKYRSGLQTCKNFIPLVEGPVTRRPGSAHVAEVKDSTQLSRLIRFEFNVEQAYILEFGDLYFRIYKDHAQVVSGTPVTVVTPYLETEVAALKFTQSADVLYLAHPSHPPAKVSRTSDTAWTYAEIDFQDGPYFSTNATATTLTCSATTGSVTVTASAVTGINGGDGFVSTDVGRSLRVKTTGADWGWGKITAVADTTHCTLLLTEDVGATTATTEWKIGLYSDTTGYPGAVGFFQDRLCWAGSTGSPSSVELSESGIYESHAPTALDNTVVDSNGLSFTLNSGDVQLIRWLLPDEKGLLIGTRSAEWLLGPNTSAEAFSSTNVNAETSSSYGSRNIQALRAGKAAVFVQSAGRRLRELAYVFQADGFRSPDLNVLARTITKGGITATAFQQEPNPIVWCARADGALLGFTYDRDQDVTAWHLHELGGDSDANGTPAAVESVEVIPTPDGTSEELWVIVKRYINGATVRYVEYLKPYFEVGDDQEDAYYVDCGVTYDSTAVTTLSAIAPHAVGETWTVLADGSAHPDVVVGAGGDIVLSRSASVVQAGYGYNSDMLTLRLEAGAADGTAQGKTQRIHRVSVRLLHALGVRYGPSLDSLDEIIFRDAGDDLGTAVPLFTGDKSLNFPGGYGTNQLIALRSYQAFPTTVLAFMPQLHTQDR